MVRSPQSLQAGIPDQTIEGVRDPQDPTGTTVELTIPGDLLQDFLHHDPVKFRNVEVAAEVLRAPLRIVQVTRRLEADPYWCYVGRPARIFQHYDPATQEETTIPLATRFLFAA